MINHIIFLVTLGITILNAISIIALLFGKTVDFPQYKYLAPDNWIFFYPSYGYRLWYWVEFFNLYQI